MNLLNLSWTSYVIAGLLALLLSVGYLYKKEISYSGGLEVSNKSFEAALTQVKEDMYRQEQSCQIDQSAVVELENEKSVIQVKEDDIANRLDKLKTAVFKGTRSALITPSTQEKITNENVQITVVLPDDGYLSDTMRKLLSESYCNVEVSDPTCNNP